MDLVTLLFWDSTSFLPLIALSELFSHRIELEGITLCLKSLGVIKCGGKKRAFLV